MLINILDSSTNEILDITDKVICRSKHALKNLTLTNNLKDVPCVLNQDAYILSTLNSQLNFLLNVSSDENITKACEVASQLLGKYETEKQYDIELYQTTVNCYKTEKLNKLQDRYIKRILTYYERNGINLKSKKSLIKIINRIDDLELEFESNINKVNTVLPFEKEQLDGLDSDILSTLETKNISGKTIYLVDLKYPTYRNAMKKVKDSNVRKAMQYAFDTRCVDNNTSILIELILLRDQHARLLGYKSHADYATQLQMAKNPENVKKFLLGVSETVDSGYKTYSKMLERLKGSKLNSWDTDYYSDILKHEIFGSIVDMINNLPKDKILSTLFELFSSLYKIDFIQEKESSVWKTADSEVLFYRVEKNKKILGNIYLDLYPRKGKFSHAACFTLFLGCQASVPNTGQLPIASIVANFSKTVWTHSEMSTLYHEFGHALNQIFAVSPICMFSGYNLEMDFVEAPSQIFENWCDEPDILQKVLPDVPMSELQKVKKMMIFKNASKFKRQCNLSLLDQFIHSDREFIDFLSTHKKKETLMIINKKFHEKILYMENFNNNTFMPSSWGHLAGGYDAKYYGYLWSNVIALMMFHTQFEGHLLDPVIGQKYVDTILSVGGDKDAEEEVSDFIGKKFSFEESVGYLKQSI